MLSKNEPIDRPKKVVIVGGGPGAFSSALSILRHTKFDLMVLLDRKLGIFTRPQYTTIFSDTAKLLKQDEDKIPGPKHKKYLARINPSEGVGTEALKRTEMAFFRQLELFKKTSPSRLIIHDLATIDSIDTNNQEIEFHRIDQKPQKNYFDFLVVADGSHRPTLHKFFLNKSPPLLWLIEQDVGYPWPYHASIILQQKKPMKKNSGGPILAVEQTPHVRKHLPAFQLHGWQETQPPHSICLPNANGTKVTISTEIPQQIFAEPDKNRQRERLKKWGQLIVSLQMDVKIDDNLSINLASKNPHLRATVFMRPAKLKRINTVALPLAHGYIVTIGDAAFDVDYRTGEGVNRAIALGDRFGKSFPEGQFDAVSFTDYAEHMAADIAKSCEAEDKSIREKRAVLEKQGSEKEHYPEEQRLPSIQSRL